MLAAAVGAAAAAGGCSVYSSAYAYTPTPVDVAVGVPGASAQQPARTLATVVGVRRKDDASGLPSCVEVRLRVENTSPVDVRFEPASLVMFDAALVQFADPIVRPPTPVTVRPGDSLMVSAYFPFGEGVERSDMDLSGLNLRWSMSIEGTQVTSSASFQRLPYGYYDRYNTRIGVGYQAYYYDNTGMYPY